MAKKKIIKRGPYEGLTLISEGTLIYQENEAKDALSFPFKQVPTGNMKLEWLTPSYCKDGDIDRCPAPCGACLENPNAGSLICLRIEYAFIFDEDASLEQSKRLIH